MEVFEEYGTVSCPSNRAESLRRRWHSKKDGAATVALVSRREEGRPEKRRMIEDGGGQK